MKTSTLANILASAALAALAAGCGDSESASGPSGSDLNSCLNDESLAPLVAQLPEGWTPSGYAAGNPDLVGALCGGECTTREEGEALLEHWINYGAAEGRAFVPETIPGSSEEPSSPDGNSQWTPSQGGGSQWTPSQGGNSQPSFSSATGTTSSSVTPYVGQGQQVMTWIPPYSLDEADQAISRHGAKFAKGLTRIGLQFWVPTYSGGVAYETANGVSSERPINDNEVAHFAEWAHNNKIAVLLCVYNMQGNFNWSLASSAFKANNGETFANALVAEVDRLGLDGVDIDLEGNGDFGSDKTAYNAFLRTLASKLHAKNKVLTVDTFHSTCYNAPNMSWWGDWVGVVDNIHSMGYEDLYEGSTTALCDVSNIFKYSTQHGYAVQQGHPAGMLLLGMPSAASWGYGGQGSLPINHVAEAKAVGTGIAIWDFPGMGEQSNWTTDALWNSIAELKGSACGFHPSSGNCGN
ncbi:MAG: hypothetical protein J6Y56_02385 [Fibrobacterales bacterium]|nr:hypothetical protein [Fibrobacterales bacterium]